MNAPPGFVEGAVGSRAPEMSLGILERFIHNLEELFKCIGQGRSTWDPYIQTTNRGAPESIARQTTAIRIAVLSERRLLHAADPIPSSREANPGPRN